MKYNGLKKSVFGQYIFIFFYSTRGLWISKNVKRILKLFSIFQPEFKIDFFGSNVNMYLVNMVLSYYISTFGTVTNL